MANAISMGPCLQKGRVLCQQNRFLPDLCFDKFIEDEVQNEVKIWEKNIHLSDGHNRLDQNGIFILFILSLNFLFVIVKFNQLSKGIR